MKNIIIFILVAGIFLSLNIILSQFNFFNLENLIAVESDLKEWQEKNSVILISGFFLAYILISFLAVPGATILAMGSGAVFGLWEGVLIASFSSSIGACFPFLVTRRFLSDHIRRKYAAKYPKIVNTFNDDSAYYLFTVRMVPSLPFFLINILMGLTSMSLLKYFIISKIGMLPGTVIFVNAGTKIVTIKSISDVLSADIILTLVLLGLFPWMAKMAVSALKVIRPD